MGMVPNYQGPCAWICEPCVQMLGIAILADGVSKGLRGHPTLVGRVGGTPHPPAMPPSLGMRPPHPPRPLLGPLPQWAVKARKSVATPPSTPPRGTPIPHSRGLRVPRRWELFQAQGLWNWAQALGSRALCPWMLPSLGRGPPHTPTTKPQPPYQQAATGAPPSLRRGLPPRHPLPSASPTGPGTRPTEPSTRPMPPPPPSGKGASPPHWTLCSKHGAHAARRKPPEQYSGPREPGTGPLDGALRPHPHTLSKTPPSHPQ